MRYGLSEQSIEKIIHVFSRYPRVERAVLYGSRAKGCFKPGSDIDLSLQGEGLTSKDIDKIYFELDDLLLPYDIDLNIFDALDQTELREHIERVGVTFYQRARGNSSEQNQRSSENTDNS